LSIGQPHAELVQVAQRTRDGKERIAAGNNPHTTRAVYRKLKRVYRGGGMRAVMGAIVEAAKAQ
jgi:hypothetical protein